MSRAIRKVLDGRYEILDTLGQGGMGKVLKCRDMQLNRIVAVKVLLANASKETAVRFHTEAKASARLKHDNIIKVLDFGCTDSQQLYLVMEYLSGESLSDYQKDGLELELALRLLVQVADGLAHAHAKGILHRDVKPSNVMLTRDHSGTIQAKVVDFGIAKLQEGDQNLTRTGAAIGTPAYMAPEAASGDKVDARADIYSFGCMMYRLLTGVLPFKGETPLETMMLHLHQEAPRLSSSEEVFSDEIESIVAKCLEKSPDQRFKTMDDVARALRAIVAEMDAQAARLAAVETNVHRYAEREALGRKQIILGAGIVVLALVCMAFAAVQFAQMGARTKKIASDDKKEQLKKNIVDDEEGKVIDEVVEKPYFKPTNELNGAKGLAGSRTVQDINLKVAADENPEIKHWKLHHTKVTGRGLIYLANLPVESLDMSSTAIDDDALEQIASMKGLNQLVLTDCHKITDDGIAHLKTLPNLKLFNLSGEKLTPAVYTHLWSFPELNSLTLIGVPLTAGGATLLAKSPTLEGLSLTETGLNSDACRELAKCKKMKHLLFLSCDITGEGLGMISKAPEVQFLNLSGTRVPENGLIRLKRMPKLRVLVVKNTGVPEQEIKQFMACRKDVNVVTQ
ncbi:MAG: protein kinase [Cyanobacteria bacterium]|nr:protein kinase [Cyanobacteriota bacterium]